MVFSIDGRTILCFEIHDGPITDMIYVENIAQNVMQCVFTSCEDGKVRMFKYDSDSEILLKMKHIEFKDGHFAVNLKQKS